MITKALCRDCRKGFMPGAVIYYCPKEPGKGEQVLCFACMKADCQKQLAELNKRRDSLDVLFSFVNRRN